MNNNSIAAALDVAAAGMADAAPAPTTDAPASDAPAATPASQPAPTPGEKLAESAPTTTPAPTIDRVTLEKLRERQVAKPQQRQQSAPDPDYAEYQAWKTARQAAKGPGIDPRALQSMPIATLEAAGIDPTTLLNTLSKHAVTPDVAALESKVEAKLAAAIERAERAEAAIEQIRTERKANAQARGYNQARQDFIANTKDGSKFPSLAKLGEERRADLGATKARELMAQGIEDFSLADVADLVEQDLHSLASELLGTDQSAAPSSPQASTSPQTTNGSASKRAATITSDAASTTSATPRRTSEKERLAAAMELARRG